MPHAENEHRKTMRRLEQIEAVIAQQRANMRELGLREDQIERALQPSFCFRDQLKEEADLYDKTSR